MWLQNEAPSPQLAVVRSQSMGAAVEVIRKHLRRAEKAQDIRHALQALFDAVDAPQEIDDADMTGMRPIGVRLAEQCLQILEGHARKVLDTRDPVIVGQLQNVAQCLLDAGLASEPRLRALLGKIEDQAVRTNRGETDSDRITQLLAWAYDKPTGWAHHAGKNFEGIQKRELVDLCKARPIYEIEALASLMGVGFGVAKADIQRREIAEQIKLLANKRVQKIARAQVKERIRGILAGEKVQYSLDDLIDY